MNQANCDRMSDSELRQYFLHHRQDQAALTAYLARVNQRPRTIIASPGDPDFAEKIQAAIREKLKASESR